MMIREAFNSMAARSILSTKRTALSGLFTSSRLSNSSQNLWRFGIASVYEILRFGVFDLCHIVTVRQRHNTQALESASVAWCPLRG